MSVRCKQSAVCVSRATQKRNTSTRLHLFLAKKYQGDTSPSASNVQPLNKFEKFILNSRSIAISLRLRPIPIFDQETFPEVDMILDW